MGASLAALSLLEPAVAVLLAVTVLHEWLPAAPSGVTLGLTGVGLAAAGVLVLARTRDLAAAPEIRT